MFMWCDMCFLNISKCVIQVSYSHYESDKVKIRTQNNTIISLSNIYIFIYACVFTQSCPTLWDPQELLFCPWDSLGKNAGVGCHFPLQKMLPTQDWNCASCGSSIWWQILYRWATWEAVSLYIIYNIEFIQGKETHCDSYWGSFPFL